MKDEVGKNIVKEKRFLFFSCHFFFGLLKMCVPHSYSDFSAELQHFFSCFQVMETNLEMCWYVSVDPNIHIKELIIKFSKLISFCRSLPMSTDPKALSLSFCIIFCLSGCPDV